MVIRIAVTVLTTAFLAAGAYAFAPEKSALTSLSPQNSTTIEKNQIWPLKGNISLDPCTNVYCQNA